MLVSELLLFVLHYWIALMVIRWDIIIEFREIKLAICIASIQVASSKEVMEEWQSRPQTIVARYIKKHLGMTGPAPRPPPPGPKTIVNTKKMKIVREESQSYE